MNIFEDIKAKLDIVQVVSTYVKLKKAGRNFKGNCPFHNENTPSFMVSPEKQIAYCFGCQKGGDVIKFIEDVESLTTQEAIELLADRAGIDMNDYSTATPVSKEVRAKQKEKKERLIDVLEGAATFYEEKLWNSDSGKKVLKYLEGRGISNDSIKSFRLGFAPESYDETYKHLLSKDFAKDDIVESGQASVSSTDSKKIYDRFRLRLMFPIFDKHGKVVGFGGRKLKKEDEPKYLNSADSPVYNKSVELYGFSHAKDAIRKHDKVVFVEGYFDVIATHQAGFDYSVATSGTALTEEQLKYIKRFTKNVYFVFDSDKAGRMATRRAVEIAAQLSITPKIVELSGVKDPDEACKAGVFKESLNGAKYYLDYYFDVMIGHADVTSMSVVEKIERCEEFYEILSMSSESIEVKHYLEKMSFSMRIEMTDLAAKFESFKERREQIKRSGVEIAPKADQTANVFGPEEYLVGFILSFPSTFQKIIEVLDGNELNGELKDVYKSLISHYNGSALEVGAFFEKMDEKAANTLKVLMLFIESQYSDRFSNEELDEEAQKIATRVKKLAKQLKKKELKFQMKEARSKGNKSEEGDFFKQYTDLLNRP